jgi:hypothetical protein
LSAFQTPRAKAEILLQSAAEIEHALMVQYLYAAYSLKTADDVTDPAQKKVLDEKSATSWPQVLLAIAREEMGHLMTVQNLLLLLRLKPNFEREDFPPPKDLYPFKLHLEPLTRRSLAKYVVAEAATDAPGIQDIVDLATESSGAPINRVGVLYGLLGVVFTTAAGIESGATGDAAWDGIVRGLAALAHQHQPPPEAWHLHDEDFHPEALSQQADPDDWQVGHLRVHRVRDRAAAIQAIRDIGEQGEGPTTADEASHFARFLAIFRGGDGVQPFPQTEWVPTRDVPTDPRVQDFTHARTRRWAELADIRYALLLGFLEHYLLGDPDERALLTGWIISEMRARIGYVARELTAMPRADGPGAAGVGAIPFTLPEVEDLHLPPDRAARWEVHRHRTEAAIRKLEEMRAEDAMDRANDYLANILASDRARLDLLSQPPDGPVGTSFVRDILPLFRFKDVKHMKRFGVDLQTYDGMGGLPGVHDSATAIKDKVSDDDDPMPPAPDARWTKGQIDLLTRWIDEESPR